MISHYLYDLDLRNENQVIDKNINKNLYKKTFTMVDGIIQQSFPGVKILPIIGNNDYYERYTTPVNSSKKEQNNFLIDLHFKNETLFNPKDFNVDYRDTLSSGFYYTYYDSHLGVKFIALNTNLYSIYNDKFILSDAENQMEFLEEELKLLKVECKKAFITMHIPPFPLVYSNTTNFFWMQNYTKRFEDLVYEYRDNIVNILTGHVHLSHIGGKREAH